MGPKPKLRRVFGVRPGHYFWECGSGGLFGYGETPGAAYQDWHESQTLEAGPVPRIYRYLGLLEARG